MRTTVTLSAYVSDAGCVAVMDSSGRIVARLTPMQARVCDEDIYRSHVFNAEHRSWLFEARNNEMEHAWRKLCVIACREAKAAMKKAKRDPVESAWDAKCEMWASTHNKRFEFVKASMSRRRKNTRYFTSTSRPDWDAACRCMYYKAKNELAAYRKRVADPWLIWCETVTNNANRRERQRRLKDDTTQGNAEDAGRAVVQMQIDWRGANATERATRSHVEHLSGRVKRPRKRASSARRCERIQGQAVG